MANLTLTRKTVLGGYAETFGACTLSEENLCLVSLAFRPEAEAKVRKAVKGAYGCDCPKPNMTTTSKAGKHRLIWMQSDQVFVAFENDSSVADSLVKRDLGDVGYVTDQTHGWVAVSLSGENALAVLERTCPVDLHPDVFPVGASTRTAMEHMQVVLVRTSEEGFLLLSASSSAQSFLHMLETSAKYLA